MKLSIVYAHEKHEQNAKVFVPMLKKILRELKKKLRKEKEWMETSKLIGHPTALELFFCGDREMREFQRHYRKLDRTTDVLSFATREAPGHTPQGFLGTLIVSLETVERAAKRMRRTTEDELCEVFVHGVLHLIGHDHVDVSPAKAARMRKLQAYLCRSTKTRRN